MATLVFCGFESIVDEWNKFAYASCIYLHDVLHLHIHEHIEIVIHVCIHRIIAISILFVQCLCNGWIVSHKANNRITFDDRQSEPVLVTGCVILGSISVYPAHWLRLNYSLYGQVAFSIAACDYRTTYTLRLVLTMLEVYVNFACLILIIFIKIVSTLSCHTTASHQQLVGFWCKIYDPAHVLKIHGVLRHQCVVSCMMTEDCVVVSHNFVHKFCILGLQICDEVAPHPEFTVQLYGMDRSICIKWKPTEEYDSSTAILYEMAPSSSDMFAVARLVNENGTYPGKYKLYGTKRVLSCRDETTLVPSGQEEYLAFDFSSCRYVWVPFITSQSVPPGAVVGGFADGVGLFIAKAHLANNNGLVIPATGYYNSATKRGYFKISGFCDTTNTMELLVLLWK